MYKWKWRTSTAKKNHSNYVLKTQYPGKQIFKPVSWLYFFFAENCLAAKFLNLNTSLWTEKLVGATFRLGAALPVTSPVRRPSSPTFEVTLMPQDNTLGWKFARPKISRLDSALAELDFEYPTIKSLKTPNNSAIVLKNSNHNNRQSLLCPKELPEPASSCRFFSSTVDFHVSRSIRGSMIVGKRSFVFDNIPSETRWTLPVHTNIYQRAVLKLASAQGFLNQNALRSNLLQGVVDIKSVL